MNLTMDPWDWISIFGYTFFEVTKMHFCWLFACKDCSKWSPTHSSLLLLWTSVTASAPRPCWKRPCSCERALCHVQQLKLGCEGLLYLEIILLLMTNHCFKDSDRIQLTNLRPGNKTSGLLYLIETCVKYIWEMNLHKVKRFVASFVAGIASCFRPSDLLKTAVKLQESTMRHLQQWSAEESIEATSVVEGKYALVSWRIIERSRIKTSTYANKNENG